MKAIKYSPEMAKARAEGRKTQTRRPMKIQPEYSQAKMYQGKSTSHYFYPLNKGPFWYPLVEIAKACPYGKEGHHNIAINVKEDKSLMIVGCDEITRIRVEKLQNISEEDCYKEGFVRDFIETQRMSRYDCQELMIGKFCDLWNSFYGGTEFSWDNNPWVWVIDFKKDA